MFGQNQEQKKDAYDSSDPFQQAANADENQGGVYVLPGVYPILQIDTLKMIRSRKGDDLFIAELEIIESQVKERPRGSRMTWIANFRHEPTPAAVKTFFVRLMGVPGEEIDADGMRMSVGEKQPCKGRLVRMEAVEKDTKSGGKFTTCNWRTLDESFQEKADQLRSDAGFPPF
jgi:hypothetical protein